MQSQKHKETWSKSSANKFGRLANGVGGRIKGTNTIKFIHKRDLPSKRMKDVTYRKFVCTICPEMKRNTSHAFCGRWQQNQLPRQSSYTKLLFNSIISTHVAQFMTMDISNLYLMTPLKRPEYVKIKLSDIPEAKNCQIQTKQHCKCRQQCIH